MAEDDSWPCRQQVHALAARLWPDQAHPARTGTRPAATCSGPRLIVSYSASFHRCHLMTRNASTSTCACPAVPSTFTTRECLPAALVAVKTTMAGLVGVPCVFTVVAEPPSRLALADPRLPAIVDIQATCDPVNENVAF